MVQRILDRLAIALLAASSAETILPPIHLKIPWRYLRHATRA